MTASSLSPAGPAIWLRVDLDGVVVDVSEPCHQPGPLSVSDASGAAALGQAASSWTGTSLIQVAAPSQRADLADWVARSHSARCPDMPFLWRARRVSGVPLVMHLHSLGQGRIAAQRAGGQVFEQGGTLPPLPPRTGPDHVLNHDVRASLRSASSFLGVYERRLKEQDPTPAEGPDPRPDPKLLATVRRAVTVADHTVDGLVRFHRLDGDALAMRRASLGDLVIDSQRYALDALTELAADPDHASLEGSLAVHGPGTTSEHPPVIARDDLLAWTLAELIVNARKFGGPTVVSVTADWVEDSWVTVSVSNTGDGIDLGLAEEAFGLGRLLQPRNERPGVGLGLPICRRIVTRHAGSIRFVAPGETERGAGTEIELELPTAAGTDTTRR